MIDIHRVTKKTLAIIGIAVFIVVALLAYHFLPESSCPPLEDPEKVKDALIREHNSNVTDRCVFIMESEHFEYEQESKCTSFQNSFSNLFNSKERVCYPRTIPVKIEGGCEKINRLTCTPRKTCGTNCPKFDMVINHKTDTGYIKLNKTVNKVNSAMTVIFEKLPGCLLLVDSTHQIYWSDKESGIIKTIDLSNSIQTLVKGLKTPGSMSISADDPGYLFWSNFEANGSIERINLSGKGRINITKGKYISYPTELTVDRYNKRLFWRTEDIVHTSDFDGKNHKIVADMPKNLGILDINCIDLTKGHVSVMWEIKSIGYIVPVDKVNYLLTVAYGAFNKTETENYYRCVNANHDTVYLLRSETKDITNNYEPTGHGNKFNKKMVDLRKNKNHLKFHSYDDVNTIHFSGVLRHLDLVRRTMIQWMHMYYVGHINCYWK